MVNQDGLRVSLGFWGPARRSEVQPGEWGLASSRMGQLIGSEGQPEDPEFYIDLPISQIDDLEVTCFFRDLDTKVLKSNIDFGFVDLYIEEAA